MYILAFDIGGTSVKYGILDRKGKIYEKGKFKTPQNDFDKLLEGIVEVKTKFQNKYEIEGLAISAPGIVDDVSGVIGGFTAVPCIHNFDIKARLRKATGFENVRIENDANCAALAEVWLGAARDYKDVMFVILGSGIGGAVIKDKKIHKGAHLQGGEFGYAVVSEDCQILSNVASPVNMAKKIAERKGIAEIDCEQVYKMAEAGDAIAIEEIEKFYFNIAIELYNLQYVYDPEVIVIGGGISARDDLIEGIEKAMDKVMEKVKIAKVRPEIKKCEFLNDANLIGAVYNYIN